MLRRVDPAQRLAEDEVGAVAGPRQQGQEQGGRAGVLTAAQIEQHETRQGQGRGRIPDAGRAFAQDDAGQDGGHDGREADGRHRAHGDTRLLDAPEEEHLEAQQPQRGGDEPAQLPVPQPCGQGMPAGAPGPEGQGPDLHAQGPDAQRMAAIRGQGMHGTCGAEAQGAEDDAQRAASQQGRAAGEPPGARCDAHGTSTPSVRTFASPHEQAGDVVTKLCRKAQACLWTAISMPHQGYFDDLKLYWLCSVAGGVMGMRKKSSV